MTQLFFQSFYTKKWPNFFFNLFPPKNDLTFFFNIFALKIKKTLRPVPLIYKYYSLDQKASGYASLKRFSHLHEVRLPTSNEGLGIFPSVARPKANLVDLFAKISGIPVLGLFWPYFFFQSFCTKKQPNFFFNLFAIKSDPTFFLSFSTKKWPNFFFNVFALKSKKTLGPVP